MSCCASREGLARLAEHPGIILLAYFCALLPLAAVYAVDFLTNDWKSIRDTRHRGHVHLAFSLPPLAVVVFYIHLQRLAKDYKEMTLAIVAAVLCIMHALGTLWGLVQLRAFKEWNMHAFHVLTRMRFKVPTKAIREEEKSECWDEDNPTSSDPAPSKNLCAAQLFWCCKRCTHFLYV